MNFIDSQRLLTFRAARLLAPWGLLAIAMWLILTETPHQAALSDGATAPALLAQTSEGDTVSLEAVQGQIVVLNFWATWCAPCRREASILERAHETMGDQGLVLGVTMDNGSLVTITDQAREMGMGFPIVRAEQDSLEAYEVNALPTTYVIDAQGSVVASLVGPVTEPELQAAISSAETGAWQARR